MGLLGTLDPAALVLAAFVAVLAGFIKGSVGFAMPMIMISGLASFLPAEIALAALILPTLVTNAMQALRDGGSAAIAALGQHRRYVVILLVTMTLAAQAVPYLGPGMFYLILGVPITFFSVVQLAGFTLRVTAARKQQAEFGIGGVAGVLGGLSGVWGPPTVIYLMALGTPKAEQMRVQGVIYGLGSVILCVAHLRSGVLNAQTVPLSVALLIPAVFGMVAGGVLGSRLDQARFRRLTLIVLVIAGLNLLRRAVLG